MAAAKVGLVGPTVAVEKGTVVDREGREGGQAVELKVQGLAAGREVVGTAVHAEVAPVGRVLEVGRVAPSVVAEEAVEKAAVRGAGELGEREAGVAVVKMAKEPVEASSVDIWVASWAGAPVEKRAVMVVEGMAALAAAEPVAQREGSDGWEGGARNHPEVPAARVEVHMAVVLVLVG